MKNCSQAQQIGENESTSIGRLSLEKQATEFGCQIKQVRDGLVVNHIRAGARRPIRRLYGRQALLDLLTKFERERKRELQILLEKRLVSNCAHRNRIQSLLKGRFLRSQNFVQNEKPTSIAATELGLLRQTHAVSDLRKGFLSRLENYEHALDGAQSDTSSNNDMEYQGTEQNETVDALKINEQVLEIEEKEQLSTTAEFIETRSQDQEGSVERTQDVHYIELFRDSMDTRCIAQASSQQKDEIMHAQHQSEGEEQEVQEVSIHLDPFETSIDSLFWQEGASQVEEWQGLLTEDEEGEWLTNIDSDEGLDVNSSGDQHRWHQETSVIDSQESHEEWSNNILHEAAPVDRTETFYSSDDDNGKRLELKNLMSRRRVSNLIQSDFRVRLEHLIQSYLERHDLGSESDDEWMLEREEQDWEQQRVNEIEGVIDSTDGADPSLPDFSQSHSDNVLQDVADWQYPDINQHVRTEWEIINGLRIDMAALQERVNNMEKMLESCMDMQLELQRVVHQEVSSALNRSSNPADSCEGGLQINEAKRGPGKEGFCFFCSNNNTDSLADRFTHVYVCSKCAEKINWSKLKKSVGQPR